MRSFPNAVLNSLAAREALQVHNLLWITARDRADNSPQSLGLWTGADHMDVFIGGALRTYHGVGGILDLEPLPATADLTVQTWGFQVSSLHAQVFEALRVYDARLAPVELHLLFCNPQTGNPLADPVRAFRGTVMELDLPVPEEGGVAAASVRCASDEWRLTRGLTVKRSDAALQAWGSGDRLRRHNVTSGSVTTAWGEALREPAPPPPPVSNDYAPPEPFDHGP